MAANYACLLVDLDGTLLDFELAEKEAIVETLQAFSLPFDDETVATYSQINQSLWQDLEQRKIKKDQLMKHRFSLLLEKLGAKADPIKMNNDYTTRLSSSAVVYPGAKEILEELSEFCTLAAASNGTYKVQMERLKKSGLLPYFDEIFISEKVGATKPSPKFFDAALQKLGLKNRNRVLMVGDSLSADIKGGQNAKIDTCWLNFKNLENTTNIKPTFEVDSYMGLKLVAVGEGELKIAATREKRHMV